MSRAQSEWIESLLVRGVANDETCHQVQKGCLSRGLTGGESTLVDCAAINDGYEPCFCIAAPSELDRGHQGERRDCHTAARICDSLCGAFNADSYVLDTLSLLIRPPKVLRDSDWEPIHS